MKSQSDTKTRTAWISELADLISRIERLTATHLEFEARGLDVIAYPQRGEDYAADILACEDDDHAVMMLRYLRQRRALGAAHSGYADAVAHRSGTERAIDLGSSAGCRAERQALVGILNGLALVECRHEMGYVEARAARDEVWNLFLESPGRSHTDWYDAVDAASSRWPAPLREAREREIFTPGTYLAMAATINPTFEFKAIDRVPDWMWPDTLMMVADQPTLVLLREEVTGFLGTDPSDDIMRRLGQMVVEAWRCRVPAGAELRHGQAAIGEVRHRRLSIGEMVWIDSGTLHEAVVAYLATTVP